MAETKHSTARDRETLSKSADQAHSADQREGFEEESERMNAHSSITADRFESSPLARSSALWRIVVSEFEAEKAAYQIVSDDYSARCREHDAMNFAEKLAPFEPFQPIPQRMETAVTVTYAKLLLQRGEDEPEPTHAEAAELFAKAASIVGEYRAVQQEMSEACERIYGDVEERHDAAVDKLSAAREKLLATPAPDAAAFLYKLDVLSAYINEVESEDAERFNHIAADIRRLLAA
jgi:hypothetical protein